MLRSLSIRDFVIVDRLDLEFSPGFTVLTGETGAGKSILIDALAMVLGQRADPVVVRAGAERAEVSAEFGLPGGELARWLADNELSGDDDGVLVRRVIEPSGRSRGYLNGRAATLAQHDGKRVVEDGFSRAGLARQHRETRRELELEALDDHEIPNGEQP